MYLDENLNFNYHTAFLCNKLSRSLFCMRRAKNFLTLPALKTLVLSGISQHNFYQIKLIEKKVIRIITNSHYTAHTAPLFAQLQVLPSELIVKQDKLLFMHSIEYDYAPSSFHGIWTKNSVNQGDRPLRNAETYSLLNPRTELFKKSSLYSLPCEWNNLDDNRYTVLEITLLLRLQSNIHC